MVTDFQSFKAEQLSNPAVKEEYDKMAPKYALIRKLIARRIELNLSQSDLATMVQTRQPAISRLEAGDNVKLETLLKVVEALDLEFDLVTKTRNHQDMTACL